MKNGKKYFLFSFLFLFAISLVKAQNLDEIIKKHIEAHGGEKAIEKIESLKITGSFTAFSIEKDFLFYKTSDGHYYGKLHLGQHQVVEAFNGKEGWTIDPWQEILFPRKLNTFEVDVFTQKALFFSPFYKYKEKGSEVVFEGKKDLEGEDFFVLKLTKSNGRKETWYLNTSTFLAYKVESLWVDFAYALPCETFFEDYREVNGMVIPFYTERIFGQRNRIIQIENVEVNPEFDRSIFEMPVSDEIKLLTSMIGSWDIQVMAKNRQGVLQQIGKAQSTIVKGATNLLKEEFEYERFFVLNQLNMYAFNSDLGRYVLSSYSDFSSDIAIYTGERNENAVVFETVSIDRDNESKKEIVQIRISELSTNSFVIERKVSKDEGKTYELREKLMYTRK